MKQIFTFVFTVLIFLQISKAQTTAMDFTMNDCNGVMHNCFTTLDSGKVIIIEFFMTCNMCINAGHQVEAMKAQLDAQYPGMIDFYQMGYTNSYSCASVTSWINANGFNSVPFDSGAALVAYYGGFGMPTLAVIAGSDHQVLYTDVGYTNGDTADIATAIHSFFNSTAVNELPEDVTTSNVFPNPATTQFNVQLDLKQAADVTIELFALNGEKVSVLANEKMNAGLVQKTFSASSFAPGLYFVKTTVNGNSSFSKVNISH
ncbi:MAG TPA: T9SS type A sorting domain-containing protein [Chitinophagales bacterium]|nr:T9SS type A sorting domain-containing protein [Chitinophagales bacterium]